MDSAQLGKIFAGSSAGGGGGGLSAAGAGGQPANASTHDFARSSCMVLDPRRCLPADTFTTVEVAKFTSPMVSAPTPGSLFVSTSDLLAYSIKGGSIRVIHRPSGQRLLIKAHSAGITDMCFTRPTDLVTCAEDGLVILWEVALPHSDAEGGEVEFTMTETLRILCPSTPKRVVAYPTNYRTLFIAHGNEVVGIVANRSCWDAYSLLPDKTVGLALDQIPQMRFLLGAHSLPVNDMSFDQSGELMVTGSEDGTVVIWELNRPKDGWVLPLRRIELNEPVSFVRLFASNNLLVGFSQSNTLRFVNTRTNNGQVLAEASFVVQQPGEQPQLRVQLVNQDYLWLCDSVNPFAVLVQIDEHHFFRRAVALQVPQPILNFSLTLGQDPDVVLVSALSAGLVHTLELPSIEGCFQVVTGGMLPPHHLPPPPPPPQQQHQFHQAAGFAQPPLPSSLPQQRMASPLPVAQSRSASPPSQSGGGGGEESDALSSMLQGKMNELFERLEHSARERQQRDDERINKLLEVFSRTLRDFPHKMVDEMARSFASSQFQDAVGQVVQAKLAEFGGGGGGAANANAQGKAVEKAVRAVLPGALDKFAEQTAAQVALKLGATRALEEAMVTRLVPAFEAGVRDLMAQFEDFYSAGAGANHSGRSPSLSARKAGGSGGGSGGAHAMGTPEKRQLCEEQVEFALGRGEVVKALQLAVEFPALLVDTCDRVNLGAHLLQDEHGFPQHVLVRLLTAVASAPATHFAKVENGASKKLEWIWVITLALNPEADEIALELPQAARLAKDELLREQHLFPLGSARFGTVMRMLTGMAT